MFRPFDEHLLRDFGSLDPAFAVAVAFAAANPLLARAVLLVVDARHAPAAPRRVGG
ncbi:hypothetical protein [Saccharothrix texasensis]|uniref:Uncharacterized protein n=1 Tax=Saccharothrix texasensis TaxID=103734 RepID=A0A3N1H4W4_9PSEU|nr:hypothetical protein [Saccharothrix texasensis]ROP37593.1 hypothetical protein EDD40_2912 [Saccharothrix texasensis]